MKRIILFFLMLLNVTLSAKDIKVGTNQVSYHLDFVTNNEDLVNVTYNNYDSSSHTNTSIDVGSIMFNLPSLEYLYYSETNIGFGFIFDYDNVETERTYNDYPYEPQTVKSDSSIIKIGPSVNFHKPINSDLNMQFGAKLWTILLRSDDSENSDIFDNIGLNLSAGLVYFFTDNIAISGDLSFKRMSLEDVQSDNDELTISGISQSFSLSVYF